MADHWSPSEAIRNAREAAGFSKAELGERLGPGLEWYNELEHDDAAAFTNLSLAHLSQLATVLNTTPGMLLIGPGAHAFSPNHSFRTLAAALKTHATVGALSVEALSKHLGLPLGDALDDPEDFWNLTVNQLRALSAAVEMDWGSLLCGGLPITDQHPQKKRA